MAKKLVEFEKWCPKCKYATNAENTDPCWDCLTIPVNEDSHRPTEFVEKEDKK